MSDKDKGEYDNASSPGQFERGFRSSLISNKVGKHAADWFKAKRDGDTVNMAKAEMNIDALRAEQSQYEPAVTDIRKIGSLRDAVNWGASSLGQAVQSTALPIVGGVAGAVAGMPFGPAGIAVGSRIGSSALSYDAEANEAAATSFMDEAVREGVDPQKVIDTMRMKGAANAALEGIMSPTALIGERVLGNTAANAIRPGMKGALNHYGSSALKGALDEAATEVTQEEVGQFAQSHLNPERDKSGDLWQKINAAAQGAIGGGVLHTPGTLAEIHRAQKPRDTDEKTLLDTTSVPPGLTDEQLLAWDDQRQQDRLDAATRLAGTIDTPEMQAASDEFNKTGDHELFASALKLHKDSAHEADSVDRFNSLSTELAQPKGEGQLNEETQHSPEDILAINNLSKHFAPNSVLAKDKDRAAEVYSALKDMMLNNPDADIPLELLARSFGGEKFMHKALTEMRGDLVRMGALDHDETAAETLQAHIGRRVTSNKAAAETIARYVKLEHKDSITQRDAGRIGIEMTHRLNNFGTLPARERAEFEAATDHLFGSNKETALKALGGRKQTKGKGDFKFGQEEQARHIALVEDTDTEVDENDHANQSVFETQGSESYFVGNKDSEDKFFNTHYDKPSARADAQKAMDTRVATAKAAGHDVEALTPAQYVLASGKDVMSVAEDLGVPTAGRTKKDVMADLAQHKARILQVTESVLDEDSVKLATKDIERLAASGKKWLAPSKEVPADMAKAVREALAESRTTGGFKGGLAKLKNLGFPNATEVLTLRDGKHIVKSNNAHGGEGRFVVVMKDGKEHTLSSQDVVNDSYGRLGSEPKTKTRPSRPGMMGRQFAMSVSSILSNPDVADIYVVDRFGKKHTPESVAKMVKKTVKVKKEDGSEGSRELTDKQYAAKVKRMRKEFGRFGPYFRVGTRNGEAVTLHQAARALATQRGDKVSENFQSMLDSLGAGDETDRSEMINHLLNIVSNDAESEALEQTLEGFGESLSDKDLKVMAELRRRNNPRNKKKKLSDEELDLLDEYEAQEDEDERNVAKRAATSGEGRSPDTHMIEEGQKDETGIRTHDETSGELVGTARSGSNEPAPKTVKGVLKLKLKSKEGAEVSREDIPKVLHQLMKAVRDTNAKLPDEFLGSMQDIYNMLAKAVGKRDLNVAKMQEYLRSKVKGDALETLRVEMRLINKEIANATDAADKKLWNGYREQIIALAAAINKLVPDVEVDTRSTVSQDAHADAGMASAREGKAADTYEGVVAALNKLNRQIMAHDGTEAQMKKLNADAAELAAKAEALRPKGDTSKHDLASSRARVAELRKAYPRAQNNEEDARTQEFFDAVDDLAIAKSDLAEAAVALKNAYRTLSTALREGEHFNKKVTDALVADLRTALRAMGSSGAHLAKHVQKLIGEYQTAARTAKTIEAAKLFDSKATNEPDTGFKNLLQRQVDKFDGKFTTGLEHTKPTMFGKHEVFTMMSVTGNHVSMHAIPVTEYKKLYNQYKKALGLSGRLSKETAAAVHEAMADELKEHMGILMEHSIQNAMYNTKTHEFATNGPSIKRASELIKRMGDDIEVNDSGYTVVKGVGLKSSSAWLGEGAARAKALLGKESLEFKWERETGVNAGKGKESNVQLHEGDWSPAKGFERGTRDASNNISADEMQRIEDYVNKVLGPKVETKFFTKIGGNGALGRWSRTNGRPLIQIITTSLSPMSVAHHESMHEFFQRLMDIEPEMAATLMKAANSPIIIRKLQQFFHASPKVLAAIADTTASGQHERVAYMYQLWLAGRLDLGPATQSIFQRVVAAFKAALGIVSNEAKAERILELFHEGSLSEPSTMAKVLANDPEAQAQYSRNVLKFMEPLYERAKYLIGTAHGQTASSPNPHIAWVGKQMYVGTGEKTNDLGFLSEKIQKTNQMLSEMKNIFRDFDEKDMEMALEGLQTRKFSADPKIRKAQERVDVFLKKMRAYSERNGLKIKEVKDYFPRAWDSEVLGKNRGPFIDSLMFYHRKEIEAIAAKGHDTYINGVRKNVKTTPEEVAERIADVLIQGRGASPNEESLWQLGFTPFMAARNARGLPWIDDKHFAKYMQKDAISILTTYVGQMVHAVEYSKRFGEKGERLQEQLHKAAFWELDNHPNKKLAVAFRDAKKKLDDERDAEIKRTKHWLPEVTLDAYVEAAEKIVGGEGVADALNAKLSFARKQIMAMEGTLGFDISERMRKIQGNLIVYENLRMLWTSLFANLVDPLGVMVHGGAMEDAFNTLRIGLTGVVDGWRGKESTDAAYATARAFGTIDASHMLNTMGQIYSSVWTDHTAKWLNDHLFRWNGVEGFGQGTRAGATVAAVNLIKRIKDSKNPHDIREMEELYGVGYDATKIKLTPEGEIDPTSYENQRAVFKLVDRMVIRPNAAMRPAYGSDGHYAIVFHMKQFTYAFQKVMLEHAAKEAKYGNYDPALVLAAGYVPVMIVADMLKDMLVYGDEAPWKKKWKASDYLTNGIQRAGLLGVPQMALDVKQWGPGELAGPVAEQVLHGARTFEKAIEKDQRLDVVAAKTHKTRDIVRAEEFDGVGFASRKVLRDAIPASQLFKRHIYDKYEPKAEKVVSDIAAARG